MEARGLYREMLTQAWRRGAQLPKNHEEIRRVTGCTLREWKRSWPLIRKFWIVEGAFMVNPTQVVIYGEAQAMQRRASDRGRAAAQAMHKRRTSDAQARPEHQPPISSHQSPEHPPLPPARGGRRYTRHDLAEARRVLKLRFGRCPHESESEPKCPGAIECEVKLAIEYAERRKQAAS